MDLVEYSSNFNEDDFIKPNCKLCNSKFRKEAESAAENGGSIMSIVRLLERNGDPISYGAVANHINYHFKTKQSETDLYEYATQLERWGKMSMEDSTLIQKYIKMLDIEITYLASKNAHVDMSERRKNQDMITKMQAQVMSLKETSKKLHAEMQPIEIFHTAFNRVIEMKLQGSISPESRRVLQDVVEQLKKEIGEVAFEGKKVDD